MPVLTQIERLAQSVFSSNLVAIEDYVDVSKERLALDRGELEVLWKGFWSA